MARQEQTIISLLHIVIATANANRDVDRDNRD
jgi:hypothetical protein